MVLCELAGVVSGSGEGHGFEGTRSVVEAVTGEVVLLGLGWRRAWKWNEVTLQVVESKWNYQGYSMCRVVAEDSVRVVSLGWVDWKVDVGSSNQGGRNLSRGSFAEGELVTQASLDWARVVMWGPNVGVSLCLQRDKMGGCHVAF